MGSPARSFFERRFPGAANLNTYSINEIATKGQGSAHCCQARRPFAKPFLAKFLRITMSLIPQRAVVDRGWMTAPKAVQTRSGRNT